MIDKNKKAVEIYSQIAEEYSKNFDFIDSDEDLIFLRAFVSHLKPRSKILDLGCGTGFSAGWFSQQGFDVEGVDLASGMIEVARRNYPAIKFDIADMRDFRPQRPVDAVWAGYSVFHFDKSDFEKTVKNIKSYLNPKGVFGIVVQEGDGEIDIPEPFLPGQTIYVHLYSETELKQILEAEGFKIVETRRKPPMYKNELPYNKLLMVAILG